MQAHGGVRRLHWSPTPPRTQLSDEIASYIREAILSGEILSGTSLNIDELARQLTVSTTPVREALLALRGEGFVTSQPRRGFTAAAITLNDITDMYWMQSELAGELAGRAASQADAELLSRLDRLQAQIALALGERAYDEVESLNFQLHRLINLAPGSEKLLWMLRLSLRYVPRHFYGSVPGWGEASAHDHVAIIAALHKRDADAAREAMKRHIRKAGALLVENLQRQGQGGPMTGVAR